MKFFFTGQFILIEIYLNFDGEEDFTVQLNNIPKKFKLSFMTEEYTLAGVVNFKSPTKHTRSATHKEIGHYTGISYRRNKWIKYDDCKDAKTILNENHIVSPHVILYIAQ